MFTSVLYCDIIEIRRTINGESPMMLNQLVKEFNRLAKAANLRRSVIIHDDPKFEGEWIAIPKEDFDTVQDTKGY